MTVDNNQMDKIRSLFELEATWKLKRSFIFRRSYKTNKLIWPFTKAYYGTALYRAKYTNFLEFDKKWLLKEEYTFLLLQNNGSK